MVYLVRRERKTITEYIVGLTTLKSAGKLERAATSTRRNIERGICYDTMQKKSSHSC